MSGDPIPQTPGQTTSEFRLTSLAIIAGVILILFGHSQEGALLLSAAVAGYSVSRGLAKKG